MELILVILFYAIIFTVGVAASRREAAKEGSKGFMLASRRLPLAVAFITMTATWVGGAYLLGTAEMTYGSGLIWAQAPWGYAVSLVIGGLLFAYPMRKLKFRTMLDPFDQRVGKKMAAWLFIPALVGEVFWSAAVLTALGLTFGILLGIPTTTAIIASGVVVVIYTMLGGLRSVAYTDVVQLGLILVGLGIALPFILDRGGGWDQVWTAYKNDFAQAAYLFPNIADFGSSEAMGGYIFNWLDFAILLVFGGIPWQVYFQRVLSSDSPGTARKMSIWAGVGCIILATPAAIIGITAATVDWGAMGLAGPAAANEALPYALANLTPALIGALGLAAVAAATMSSMDSSILSVSSMFSWNVFRRIVKPGGSDRSVERVTKFSIPVVGILAIVLALTVQSVYALWYLCSDFVFVILFPQLLNAIYNKRYNIWGAASGAIVGLILRFGGGEPTFGLPAFIPYPLPAEDGTILFPFRAVAMIGSLLTIIIVSYATQKKSPSIPLKTMETDQPVMDEARKEA